MLYTRMMAWINCAKVTSLPLCGLKESIFSQNATSSRTRELLTYNHGLRECSKRDKEIDYRKNLEV